jgi:hypothetical protein
MLKGKLDNRRRRERPRKRWIEDVMADLETMGIRGRRIKTADREVWRAVVNEAKTHQGLLSQRRKILGYCLKEVNTDSFHNFSTSFFNTIITFKLCQNSVKIINQLTFFQQKRKSK